MARGRAVASIRGVPIVVLGVSHHVTAADDLARFTSRITPLVPLLVTATPVVAGGAVLTTCNRFEVYLDASAFHPAVDAFMALLPTAGVDHLRQEVVIHVGQGAVEHLFEVACGLDAMVVGEVEISGQVREALTGADDMVSPALRRLFQTALTTSKAVTTQTALGAAGRSVASVGLDLAEQRHGRLAGGRALVVGTGSYARVVVADLLRRGCSTIGVYSATGRADTFAASHPVTPVSADSLPSALADADLVVTCSGVTASVLGADPIVAAGRSRTLPVVELSLGGDLTPEARALPGLDVIDLDEIGTHAPIEHAAALESARDLIRRGVETFLHLEEGRMAAPAVTAMRAHVSRIIEDEIETASRRHDFETAEAIARSLRRVSNALLHTPSVRAAELARTGALEDYRQALHTLFGIEVDD